MAKAKKGAVAIKPPGASPPSADLELMKRYDGVRPLGDNADFYQTAAAAAAAQPSSSSAPQPAAAAADPPAVAAPAAPRPMCRFRARKGLSETAICHTILFLACTKYLSGEIAYEHKKGEGFYVTFVPDLDPELLRDLHQRLGPLQPQRHARRDSSQSNKSKK